MSNHGTNFVGAARELKELNDFLSHQKTQQIISDFTAHNQIFIPEHAYNFGGLWEAAIKSFKKHMKQVTSNIKFSFEELTTVLTQVEVWLNSTPLVSTTCDDNGIEVLTP